MGASFTNETYSWKKPGEYVTVEKYASKISQSRVRFQTLAGEDEFRRRNDSQKKANARDL